MREKRPLAIAAETPDCLTRARELAERLALPLCELDVDTYPLLLVVTSKRLELRETGPKTPGPLYVDFLGGAQAHRRKYGGGRRQLIARAIGLRRGGVPRVLDATAGLGRDAFVLACLGCPVVMIERSPVVAALLEDGLLRAREDPAFSDLQLTLEVGDAVSYLSGLVEADYPDVVYLDPMFPPREKSALVKKAMRYLQKIVGDGNDAEALLDVALQCAKKRVVVKRPRLAPSIGDRQPNAVVTGKSSRFDIYFNK